MWLTQIVSVHDFRNFTAEYAEVRRGTATVLLPRETSARLCVLCGKNYTGRYKAMRLKLREELTSSPPDDQTDPSAVIRDLPLPGPAGWGGPALFYLRFVISSNLSILNRHQRREIFDQIDGEELVKKRINGREPRPESYEQKVEYTLPFRGEWLVMNGGVNPETSHSWDLLAQRYAYDFVIADPEGRRHRGRGRRPEDYFCYGEQILAPADGEVVEVIDGVRDAPRVGTGWVDWRSRGIGGNSVTIRHAEGEYSYLAHLLPGSVRVMAGQCVQRGEEVGRCGNSGHSTEPHLHFQVQDESNFYQSAGLPVRFSGVLTGGSEQPRKLHLTRGMRVRGKGNGKGQMGNVEWNR